MIDVDVSTTVDRAPADVYAFVTDPTNRAKWDRSVLSEELTSPGPLAAGSTLHTRMRIVGQDTDIDWHVDEVVPPRRLAVTSTSGPLQTSMVMDLVPAGSGTTLTAHLTAQPEGMMRIVEPIIESSIRRELTDGLARLKALLEA